MSECGGWYVPINNNENIVRLLLVASHNIDDAIQLAINKAGGGSPLDCTEISKDQIAKLCLEPNEVGESKEIGS